MIDLKNQKAELVTKQVKEAGERALLEAQERKLAVETEQNLKNKVLNLPKEINGRGGLDPVRYGDWEKKGLAVDF